ncbi:MAG: polysaccharide biosynthesis tyrosine autokinase, partial [Gemmatimonadetes bacterium]|nr:polysaccharide biosynthesis tyrosine autokinase [Gemmatimonadota bacterium]
HDQSVRVIDHALYPTEPIRPKPWLSLFVAVIVGVVVGVGGAVVAEHMDRTVRDRAELQAVTGSAVLGLIPMIAGESNGARFRMPWFANGNGTATRPRLVGSVAAGHPAAEAYRSLRTNINFARPDAPPKALVFTSPMPGDGKSTTAANMALVLAQQGTRVLLVDADMRRGALNEAFEQPAHPGLSNVLVGGARAEDAIRRITIDQGHTLDFLPAGTRPPNPAELLSSEGLDRFVREMSGRYDVVVFDAPPLNLVTDAALLGAKTDGLLLVARAGVTEEEPLAFAVDQIHRVRATLLGTILNGVDERRQGYYGSQGTSAHGYFIRS